MSFDKEAVRPLAVEPNDIVSGVDRSHGFKNAGGVAVSADNTVIHTQNNKNQHLTHKNLNDGSVNQINVNDQNEFPSLNEAINNTTQPDTRVNRDINQGDKLTVSEGATAFGGSSRGRTEISGSSHSHGTGHPPDRTARVIGHRDQSDDIAPPTEEELLAQEKMRSLHQESDFVNRDITPAERAAREQQAENDRKYQQRHSTVPDTAKQYELTEQERQNLVNDALHHESIDARKAVKHEVFREIGKLDKDATKELQRAADEKHNIANAI